MIHPCKFPPWGCRITKSHKHPCPSLEIMKLLFSIVSVVALASCAQAYNLPASRRDVFAKAAVAAVAFVPAVAQAMDTCPAKSTNCIRTAWTPPAGTSMAGAAKTVKAVLNDYPQGGTMCNFVWSFIEQRDSSLCISFHADDSYQFS
jgi:hypothetical protein